MALEVTIEKKHAFVFLGLVVLIAGLFIATAYDSNPGAPATLGHTVNEIGPGSRATSFGGSSTFGGAAANWYAFPGHLGIGPDSIDTVGRNLYIKDTDSGAGIGIDSAGSNAYIDFISNGIIKSNIDSSGGYLLINAHDDALATHVKFMPDAAGGNVGIGAITGAPSEKLEVTGRVKANGFCIGADCRTSWSGGGSVAVNDLPIGTWCGRSWFNLVNQGIQCGTNWPHLNCPFGFAQTLIETTPSSIYVCIKNA